MKETKTVLFLAGLLVLFLASSSFSQCVALPGDANASGTYTLADVIMIINYIFNKPGCTPQPTCWLSGLLCRGDVKGDGKVDLADAICLVNSIFGAVSNASYTAMKCPCCCVPQPSGTCCLPVPGCS